MVGRGCPAAAAQGPRYAVASVALGAIDDGAGGLLLLALLLLTLLLLALLLLLVLPRALSRRHVLHQGQQVLQRVVAPPRHRVQVAH